MKLATTRRRVLAVAVAAAVVATGVWAWKLDDGRTVVDLEAGRHPPMTISEPTVVRGQPGAVVEGGIVVASDDVRIEGVTVEGGHDGVSIRDADGVVLSDVVVRGAELHGIEVVRGSASIRGCEVSGLTHQFSQGIEIRNTNGHPRTTVEGCRISGSPEGIVTHVSRVEIRGNVVTATTNKAIAVTEMSEGIIERNTVRGVTGVALFCGDMSRCEVRHNRVEDVRPHPGGAKSRSGQALVAWYYSRVREHGNDFRVAASPAVGIHYHSTEMDAFPLSRWPAGWRGAVPGLGVVAIALGALVVARTGLSPLTRRLRHRLRRVPPLREHRRRLGRDLLIAVGATQVFHVVEHVVQVTQVYVAQAENRQGLVGQHFDTEWLHLAFNAVVLGGVVLGCWYARHSLARRGTALDWLVAGVVLQTWHVAEHVVRVVQYLRTGATPAPGIVGGDVGLVWFHFGINVPIMAALLVVGGPPAWRWLSARSTERSPRETPVEVAPAA